MGGTETADPTSRMEQNGIGFLSETELKFCSVLPSLVSMGRTECGPSKDNKTEQSGIFELKRTVGLLFSATPMLTKLGQNCVHRLNKWNRTRQKVFLIRTELLVSSVPPMLRIQHNYEL